MTDWEPIETAPKDGRLLLLCCDYGPDGLEMCIAHACISVAPGGRFGPFVWRTIRDGGHIAERIPTHWMPLPPFPPQKRQGET